jgi:N-acetylmuramoyl-L-alanine amidase
MTVIVIDAGHGGAANIPGDSSANNATGPTGLKEKTVTLEVAKRFKQRCGHLDVRLTRSTDVNMKFKDRAKVAKDAKAAAFISVHFNGWKTPDVQGTETYMHSAGTSASLALARAVQKSVRAATGLADRGVKKAAFGVINPAHHHSGTAACLAEISFMTTAKEEQRLKTDTYLDALADALISGVDAFLALDLAEMVAKEDVATIEEFPGTEDAASVNLDIPS